MNARPMTVVANQNSREINEMNQNLNAVIDLLATATNLLRDATRGTQQGTRGIRRRTDRAMSTHKRSIRGTRRNAVTPIHHAGTVKKAA
jgi:ElaB/YqjD/DUF883 family membrane-anchored ribosome-binding protein